MHKKLATYRILSGALAFIALFFAGLYFMKAKDASVVIPSAYFVGVSELAQTDHERLKVIEDILIDQGLWPAGIPEPEQKTFIEYFRGK